MRKRRTAIARSMCRTIFSRYCGQRTMTNKGAKRNVPYLLQAQQALSVFGRYWKRSSAKSSTAFSPSQLFPAGYAGIEVHMGQCFSRFPTNDQRQIDACCACSKCGTFLFAPSLVIVLWPQYREKIALHMLRAIAVLRFRICALKSCPAPAALAAGAGLYFSLTAYNPTF